MRSRALLLVAIHIESDIAATIVTITAATIVTNTASTIVTATIVTKPSVLLHNAKSPWRLDAAATHKITLLQLCGSCQGGKVGGQVGRPSHRRGGGYLRATILPWDHRSN